MVKPPPPLKSLANLRKFCNQLRKFAIATQPLKGRGTTMVDSPGGIAINAASGGGGGTGETCLGFKLSGSGEAEDTVAAGDFCGTAIAEHTGALDGDVYGHITLDADGEITVAEIIYTGTKPADTATDFYVLIGNWTDPDLTQYRCGPITVTVCRDWFSNPGTYGVTWA